MSDGKRQYLISFNPGRGVDSQKSLVDFEVELMKLVDTSAGSVLIVPKTAPFTDEAVQRIEELEVKE